MLSMMNVHLKFSRTRPVTDVQHFERQPIPLLELSLLYSHTTLFWMKIYLWIITIHGNSLCYPKQHNWLWSLCPILERTSVFLNLALNSWNIASFLNFSSYDSFNAFYSQGQSCFTGYSLPRKCKWHISNLIALWIKYGGTNDYLDWNIVFLLTLLFLKFVYLQAYYF